MQCVKQSLIGNGIQRHGDDRIERLLRRLQRRHIAGPRRLQQGGDCVLVARDGAGSWSSPAFYGLGSASFGFQAGIQDAEIVMMIMTLWIQAKRAPWSPDFAAKVLPGSVIASTDVDVNQGAMLFHTKGCEFCHTIDGFGGPFFRRARSD